MRTALTDLPIPTEVNLDAPLTREEVKKVLRVGDRIVDKFPSIRLGRSTRRYVLRHIYEQYGRGLKK